MSNAPALMKFAADIASGRIQVGDLTQTLSEDTPVLVLPPPFGQCEGFSGGHFEASANEATAAAMLAASVNYPLRGAMAWKSVIGTNVASDALSNLASGGVTGGALIIVGEDYATIR